LECPSCFVLTEGEVVDQSTGMTWTAQLPACSWNDSGACDLLESEHWKNWESWV